MLNTFCWTQKVCISRVESILTIWLILYLNSRFELAVQLGDMKTAYELAAEAGSEQKWKQLAELATAESNFLLAQECLHKAQDFGGLLLLATSSGMLDTVTIWILDNSGPKCPVFNWSAKSRDFTIWIPDTHAVRYSDGYCTFNSQCSN